MENNIQYISCPNCDSIQNKKSQFCTHCGYALNPSKIITSMSCSKCGKEYSDNKNYCPDDGTKLTKVDFVMSSIGAQDTALSNAEDAIRQSLGDLSDLEYELANTIANIYYKQALVDTKSERIPYIEGHIQNIRSVKSKDYKVYEILCIALLCQLKYRMKTNPMKKTVFRLKIEMKLRQKYVDEIPDLVKKMGLY